MFEFLKKKYQKTPNELGRILYNIVQMGIQQENLSFKVLFNSLDADPEDFVENYEIEIMIALLFQVILAIESTYKYHLSIAVLDGMNTEFAEHLIELGYSKNEFKNVFKLYHKRIVEYYFRA
jgi:hypothetical protein